MKPNAQAVGIGDVVVAELADIANRRGEPASPSLDPSNWIQECHQRDLFGISLSGGGIRSATFALGVLQGLAERDLLQKVDYLSTVSGGGYIGSWLQGVLHQSGSGRQGYDALKVHVPGSPNTDPISFLRKYSDFLSPRAGLSLDGLLIPIIWLRNTMLNQVIIVTAFLAAFILALVPGAAVRHIAKSGGDFLLSVSLLLAFVSAVVAVTFIGRNLSRIEQRVFGTDATPFFPSGKGTEMVGALVVLPLFLGVVFLLPAFISPQALALSKPGQYIPFLILWALLAALQWGGGFVRCCSEQGQTKKFLCWLHVFWMSLSSAGFIFILMRTLNNWIRTAWDPSSGLGSENTIAWAPPLYLVILMAGITLLIGLMGSDFPDASREWLARTGAFLWVIVFVWAGLFAAVIFSPYWVVKIWIWKETAIISSATAWVGTTIASVLAGKSGKTGSVDKDNPDFNSTLDVMARYGPAIAVAGFTIALAFALQVSLRVKILEQGGSYAETFVKHYWDTLPYSRASWCFPVILFLAVVLIFVVFSVRVNINEFSMHHFYKNRLVRCFLGASATKKRAPDSFTGFDPQDDIQMNQLRCDKPGASIAPYPILNATLTVTSGSELATQERKAVPWIFTPLFSGFFPEMSAGNQAAATEGLTDKAFVDTSKILGGGVHLGTAMAISGAAINPSSGFHSAPQTAFLLTLFDARLGWWIGNPRDESTYRRTGPRFAWWCLLRELFGFVDDQSAYLNLSDGGNFENLGLYELVRRRCRFVIGVDAEEDPNYVFESLGGAVRKCREDFGVEIVINPRPIQAKDGLSSSHCAIGRIYYPPEENSEPGWLLYIKTSITGDEPADVEEYRRKQTEFPQQSTLEQFFQESQFESYRRLGLHEAGVVFGSIDEPTVMGLFERLANRWELPPEAPEGGSAGHAEEYDQLIEKLADSPELIALDSEVLENFPKALEGEGPLRSAFFFRRQLLGLMETVFLELNFASAQSWNHPINAGWQQIFIYWTQQEAIRALWKAQKSNFGKPFQDFFDDLITRGAGPPHRFY